MKTVSLASGSKGNCIYVESNQTSILVDDGLSLSSLEARLKKAEVDSSKIDAILLTHEHSDHLSGIKVFLNKHKNTKVYIPAFVREYGISGILALPSQQVEWFTSSNFFIKDITVSCFILPHDSNYCVGYSMYFDGKKISVCTDLGFVSNDTLKSLSGSDILFLESNYDENLLRQNPRYPIQTKKRILGNNGHLSNISCAQTLVKLSKTGIKQVILSHLSEENNTPNLAYSIIKKILLENGIEEGKNLCIDVAFQNDIGTIFNL